MMTSLGVPSKGSVLDRYVRNLPSDSSLQPPPQLRRASQSRLNSSQSLKEVSKLDRNFGSNDDKENAIATKVSSPKGRNLSPKAFTDQSRTSGSNAVNSGNSGNGSKVNTTNLSKEEKGYYEFLCRVSEIKQWIERVIGEELPSEVDLSTGDSLRNGVYLAKVTQRINPELAPSVFPAGKTLQFKHTQNINAFFNLVDHVGLPNSFRFELQDLYNKQDLPQVFETLYILITMINKKWPTKTPIIENLSGKVSFSKEDLKKCKKSWPRIRDFKSLNVNSVKSTVGITVPTGAGLIQDFNKVEANERSSKPSTEPETPKQNSVSPEIKNGPVAKLGFHNKPSFGMKLSSPTKTKNSRPSRESMPEVEFERKARRELEESEEEQKEEQEEEEQEEEQGEEQEEPKKFQEYYGPNKFERSVSTPVRRTRKKLESINLSPPASGNSLGFPPILEHRDYGTVSPIRSPSFRPVDSDIRSRSSHLEYSPLKSTSLSYYSPTISRYLTYDTDFYVRRSRARERGIDFYQTYKYEPVSYSPQRKQRMTEMEFLDQVIRLQSICRGANARFDMHIQLRLLKLFEKEIIHFQSIMRGNKIKSKMPRCFSPPVISEVQIPLRFLKLFEEEILHLQCIIRGNKIKSSISSDFSSLIKDNLDIQLRLLRLFEREMVRFQSIIRGNKKRSNIPQRSSFSVMCDGETNLIKLQSLVRSGHVRYCTGILEAKVSRRVAQVEALQSLFRGSKIRRFLSQELCDSLLSNIPLMRLQSWTQGCRCRKHIGSMRRAVNAIDFEKFQSSCRGLLYRRRLLFFRQFNNKALSQLGNFQKRIRVSRLRNSIYELIYSAEAKNRTFKLLSGILRGHKLRESMRDVLCGTGRGLLNIPSLQGIVRGVLVRYTLDLVDDIIEFNNLYLFQADIKGALVRSQLDERANYFKRNERSVVIIQSKMRAFIQRESFFDLLHHPNPHIRHVRKYAYLLNNTGTIEENQEKLEACQAQLDSENLKKENFEKNIREQLDISDVLEKYGLINGLTTELKGLDIPYGRYPTYEKLLFLLQVDPSYWKILYVFEPEFVERNIYVSFSTVNQNMGKRERIYFIRVIADILQQEVREARSISQYLAKPDRFWNRMLKTFLRREYPEVFTLFEPLLKYINNPKIDFESDPLIIYKSIHHSEPANRSVAIDDEQTKLKFIENLRNLWHAIEMTAEIFTRKLREIPLEVRFIASKMFTCAADKNTDEIGVLRSIAVVLVNSFISEYVDNRASYGFESKESPALDAKVHSFMKSLEIVFGLGKFTGYYEPLNQYADEIDPQLRELLFNIILDPGFEQEADTLVYKDMVSTIPQLEILTEKVLIISSKFREYLLEFPDDDVIHEILKKNPTSKDFKRNGRIVLDLTASAYRFLVCDDRMRKVYDQVKRAMVYMMQVEEVETNLSDLVVSSVLPQDEPNFKKLMNNNPGIRNDPMVKALKSPRYFNMKSSVLKKLQGLERSGIIKANSNQLQNFLNDIANTIKNPHYAINYVTEELYLTQETLKGVSQINKKLDKALVHLRTCINEAIRNILRSRNFNPSHKSALDNLKGAYKKVQTKKSNRIEGTLKFKWTTRQLYEKGVIKSIESENLAEQKVKVFGSSGPKFPDISFRISTSDGASYGIQLLDRRKGLEKNLESVDSFTFRDLLKTQVGTKVDTWQILNKKVSINTSQLLELVVDIFLKSEY